MSARLQRWLGVALIGAGLALTLLAAAVTISTPGVGLPPDQGPPLRLAEGAGLEWAFVAETPGLAGITVWFAEPPPPGAALVLAVGDVVLPDVPLAATAVPADQAGPDLSLLLPFEPLPRRASAGGPQDLAVRLTVRGAEVAVRAGVAQQSGERTPAFAPFYCVRPLDAVWPVSQMAAGRPGPLGWPPLYALVPYCFLLLLLYSLRTALRLVAPQSDRHAH